MCQPELLEDAGFLKETQRMAALSGAARTDAIAVVGPHSFDHAMALLRSGFERAICLCGPHPSACGEHFEHLFVCGPMDDAELRDRVSSLGRHLGRGGSLVARLRDVEQDAIVRQILADAGVQPAPVFDLSRDILVSHRLVAPATQPVAPAKAA